MHGDTAVAQGGASLARRREMKSELGLASRGIREIGFKVRSRPTHRAEVVAQCEQYQRRARGAVEFIKSGGKQRLDGTALSDKLRADPRRSAAGAADSGVRAGRDVQGGDERARGPKERSNN